jgi:hypothetical protein
MWNLGTTTIPSTDTGSLYVGTNIVKKVYQGQLQVYPDYIPFPTNIIYDWWVADDQTNVGRINSHEMNPGDTFYYIDLATLNNHLYFAQASTSDHRLRVSGVFPYVIAAGILKNPDGALSGNSMGIETGPFSIVNRFYVTAAGGSNSFCYSDVPTPPYFACQTSPSTIGFMMNVWSTGSGGLREVYVNSSTPAYSASPYNTTYPTGTTTPGISWLNPVNGSQIAEVLILTSAPSTADLTAYRSYLTVKYGIVA